MYIAVTMNGVVQTPTVNFIVRSSCKPLVYSTINGVGAPYAYEVPTTNQAALETLFPLLTSTTSQLT